MFKKLGKLDVKRNFLGAIGFYITYFMLGLLIAMICGALFANTESAGFTVGQKCAIIYSLAVAFLILKAKKELNNTLLIMLALLSGVAAVYAGLLGGLIIPAYLTTLASPKKSKKK